MQQGAAHVSCSTVSPQTARSLATDHKAAGVDYIAAPIFARPDGVASKTGTFMVSGSNEAVDRVLPLLKSTISTVYRFGEDPGAANVVKLCGNFLIASSIEAIGEALALAEGNGVDRVEVMNMLSETIFNCLIYKGYGKRISERDHSPGGFALELGLKDVRLVSAVKCFMGCAAGVYPA